MDAFQRRDGAMHGEGVSLDRIAQAHGTPAYVYSSAAFASRCEEMTRAFGPKKTLVCFAVKASSNLSILRLARERGLGADVVSLGELMRAREAGFAADHIVFSGVGKREDEIVAALEGGVLSLNVESIGELDRIASVARRLNRRAPIGLRLNPNIDAKTNPHIATGLYSTKFGIAESDFERALKEATRAELKLISVGCHIGSQIVDLGPFREAARRMTLLAKKAIAAGHTLSHLDLGGGLGIRYNEETPPSFRDYASALLDETRDLDLRLVVEPGRCLVAESAVLLTRVIDVKETPEKTFVIVDAAMNDLIRPSLYDAHHTIETVAAARNLTNEVDIVGPVCETGDYLGRDRKLPEVRPGELLVVRACGAYGSSMASNYNTRPRAPEILVDGESHRVIRRRETLDDLLGPERAP